MSEEGLKILTQSGISATYEELVSKIINRAGDGICPMEMAVRNLDDPHLALQAVLNKIELFRKGKIE